MGGSARKDLEEGQNADAVARKVENGIRLGRPAGKGGRGKKKPQGEQTSMKQYSRKGIDQRSMVHR